MVRRQGSTRIAAETSCEKEEEPGCTQSSDPSEDQENARRTDGHDDVLVNLRDRDGGVELRLVFEKPQDRDGGGNTLQACASSECQCPKARLETDLTHMSEDIAMGPEAIDFMLREGGWTRRGSELGGKLVEVAGVVGGRLPWVGQPKPGDLFLVLGSKHQSAYNVLLEDHVELSH